MVRFCPYCSAENTEDAAQCVRCARRLPALPARRAHTPRPTPLATTATAQQEKPMPSVPLPRETSSTASYAQPRGRPARASTPPPPPGSLERARTRPDSSASRMLPDPTLQPPPTRPVSPPPGSAGTEPLPVVDPMPEVPDTGLYASARYTLGFLRGILQRRAAVKNLHEQIRVDTSALDTLLGALGRLVRDLRIDTRATRGENEAIDEAERRKQRAQLDSSELGGRLADENQRFAELEKEREGKLRETEAALEKAEQDLEGFEAQRRSLREKRKQIERQQKAYLKAAEDREEEAGKQAMGETRSQLRRSAEELRREAASLDPERQDIERRLSAVDKPLSQAAAQVETLRAELESTRRSLTDAREGHRQRFAELEAQHGSKGREVTEADNEVARRLVTLGTLVNLNRIERPEFDELYGRIDMLRNAIGSRTQHIDRLNAERESADKAALLRGAMVVAFAAVLVLTAVVLLIALL
jgi:septal ring factor EnvC (AmiA/AmiB activator)